MRRVVVLGMLASMLALFHAPANAQGSNVQATPFEKVVAYVQPSVVYLHITWKGWVYDKFYDEYLNDGDPFVLEYSCTGFVVNSEGYIATAGHCVDRGDPELTRGFFDQAAFWAWDTDYYSSDKGETFKTVRKWADEDYRLEAAAESVSGQGYKKGADLEVQAVWSTESTEPLHDKYGDLNGTPVPARLEAIVPWNNGEGDTALLKLNSTNLPPPLPIADQSEITTGTEVVSIGYPASVGEVSDATLSDPSFKEGAVSSVRTSGTYPVYEMDAAMSGGMSGGPTVNLDGEVVGINSFGHDEEVSEFQFVQASSTLRSLMMDTGVPNELGELGTAYRKGLDAYFAGKRAVAVKNLSQATDIDEDFDFAQEYLDRAQALPIPEPESSLPIIPIGIGVVVVLALVGGYLLMQRRKSVAPESEVASEAAPELEARTGNGNEPRAPVTVRPNVEKLTWPVFCENCGEKMRENARFCAVCGTRRSAGATAHPGT